MARATTRQSYAQAIQAAQHQAMALDDSVFVNGIGADGAAGIFGTTAGLVDVFGPERVFDTPISEQALTAMAGGAASAGLRPVLVHQRLDFMLYAVDPLVNWISLWRYISGGQSKMPITVRAIVGKGWGQGPQHLKSLHTWFAHIPGLQVVMPGTPVDAKGLLLSAIFSNAPTVVIEGRSLFSMTEEVPDEPYFIRLGKALIRRPGKDVTLVSIGSMVPNTLHAATLLEVDGIDTEVVDLRTLSPLDMESVVASVKKTGRLVVAEPGWLTYGSSAEIIAGVAEVLGNRMKALPRRVGWPQTYVPTSSGIESDFYPDADDLVTACREACNG